MAMNVVARSINAPCSRLQALQCTLKSPLQHQGIVVKVPSSPAIAVLLTLPACLLLCPIQTAQSSPTGLSIKHSISQTLPVALIYSTSLCSTNLTYGTAGP